ncbi:MAG: helix-turn-helix domain-containing protein [Actinoplanes sp.]
MSKPAAPPLMAIFRSQVQAEVLTSVMLSPGQRSITDLATKLGAPYATVHREVERLLEVGLLAERRVGRTRLLSPNTASPAYRPLRDLVLVAFGPREVIMQEFGELNRLEGLLIYGSWAARYCGEEGPEPGDIDVLVIGNVDRDDAFEAAERAQARLEREVNPQLVTSSRWHEGGTPFLTEVKQRSLVTLVAPSPPPSLTQSKSTTAQAGRDNQ